MSTDSVPGAKAENNDRLAMGCWAEHQDGSLILVQSTEDKRVIYDVFSLGAAAREHRDVMAEKAFLKAYSYAREKDKGDGVSEQWTWHDKTPFPWQRVIDAGSTLAKSRAEDPGGVLTTVSTFGKAVAAAGGGGVIVPYQTSEELLTAAQRVAATLQLKGKDINPAAIKHRTETTGGRTGKDTVIGRIKNAFGALRGE